ncbi:MAG: hypothetical protein H6839_03615 [Planctomycetes bacterium]|nr:hypothetical protein [Planctomycetota bacterium]
MNDRELPTHEELLNGRMADGSQPPLRSAELTPEARDVPGEEDKSPAEIERDRLHYDIDRQHLDDLDLVCNFARKMVNFASHAIDHPEEFTNNTSPRPARQGGDDDSNTEANSDSPNAEANVVGADGDDDSESASIPALPGGAGRGAGGRPNYSMNGTFRSVGAANVPHPPHDGGDADMQAIHKREAELKRTVRQYTGASNPPAMPKPGQLKLEQAVAIGERGSKLLIVASSKRAAIAHALVEVALRLDTRKSFMQNRAIAVVYATLLHLDDSFQEVGFGAWMPFRFPDQWLAFCGIMRRVLAANGLIHSKHAEIYRKLLDETPPVETEDDIDERIRQAHMPANPALCARNQSVKSMYELAKKLNLPIPPP